MEEAEVDRRVAQRVVGRDRVAVEGLEEQRLREDVALDAAPLKVLVPPRVEILLDRLAPPLLPAVARVRQLDVRVGGGGEPERRRSGACCVSGGSGGSGGAGRAVGVPSAVRREVGEGQVSVGRRAAAGGQEGAPPP